MKQFRIVFSAIFLFSILNACKKDSGGNNTPGGNLPSVRISDVLQNRSTASSKFTFNVYLSATSTSPVTVKYTTVEGTAKAGTDFTATSGTLTIPANTTQASIDVEVLGDSARKDDQLFYVDLNQPVNCTISGSRGTGDIQNNGTYLPVDDAGYSTPDNYPGYTLVWHDEFDGKTLSTDNWTYELGAGGWGNNELENYTNSVNNSFLSQGKLIIEARKESGSNNYSSARIISKDKKQFTYGRIDIRAKLPVATGLWPALWMLGSNISTVNWPACGELDIMEVIGKQPSTLYGTMHWAASNGNHQSKGGNTSLTGEDFSQKFHVFSIDWKADKIRFLLDDQEYFSGTAADVLATGPNPFTKNFFFIMNVAVGGNWPGSPDGTTVFPQRMFVDYVRIFQ